ncbi:hypothetical protein, partial [Actinoplanes sp. GCM10030250]|uniref:hypothetical protein n=1 Tax=Actinoplanes sp. GCM10030250 TaxID=3273376 RepID=UPI0036152D70
QPTHPAGRQQGVSGRKAPLSPSRPNQLAASGAFPAATAPLAASRPNRLAASGVFLAATAP